MTTGTRGPGGRDLRILVGAAGLTTLGDHAALTALVLLVHEATGSSAAVAALLLGLWGPVVALGGVAGAICDRVENVRLLVLGALAQAVVVATMVAVATPLAVILLAPLLGVGIAIVQPAEFALIPAAAGSRTVAVAGGRVETARYVGMALGPVVGGGLAAAGQVRGALALDVLTFLVVALAVGRMTARRPPGATATGRRPRARDGALALASDRILRTTLAGAVASLLVVSATIVALVAFADEVLDVGGAGYGALVAVWTAGMVAGALGVARRVPARWHATAALAAVVLQGLGILAGAAAAVLWVVVLGHLAGGAAQGAKNVLLRALIHERVPGAMHGRAYAAYNAARNAAELGALIGGAALVATLGARGTLVVAGAGSAAIGVLALAVLRTKAPRIGRQPSLPEARVSLPGLPEGWQSGRMRRS